VDLARLAGGLGAPCRDCCGTAVLCRLPKIDRRATRIDATMHVSPHVTFQKSSYPTWQGRVHRFLMDQMASSKQLQHSDNFVLCERNVYVGSAFHSTHRVRPLTRGGYLTPTAASLASAGVGAVTAFPKMVSSRKRLAIERVRERRDPR
jgi:hypothetical protein